MNRKDEFEITDEEYCDLVNYEMLSDESSSISGTPDGDSCIMSWDELIYTIQDCDCSDPENYEFYNK